MKLIGPFDNALEASKGAIESDLIINVINPVKPKPKITKVTVDFDAKQVITEYDDNTSKVEEIQDIKSFFKKDLTKLDKPVIKGTPPIEGVCYDEMLHM